MKTQNLTFAELKETLKEENFGGIFIEKGKHYGWAVGKIKFIPQTIQQAKAQVKTIKNGGYDDLLMVGAFNSVERFMNENGFEGSYSLTKSKTMCRLENVQDYVLAIKKAFEL